MTRYSSRGKTTPWTLFLILYFLYIKLTAPFTIFSFFSE
jgi:hypothetical protein